MVERGKIRRNPPNSAASGDAVEYKTHVRYAETDKMHVVYYGNYLTWFEAGRSAYGRKRGLLYSEFERGGYYLIVAEACCRYKMPLRYNDEVLVKTVISEATKRTIKFEYEIYRLSDMALSAIGHTTHVCIDRETGKPATLPGSWLKLSRK